MPMVSHDLAVIAHMCRRIAVMRRAEIVEILPPRSARPFGPAAINARLQAAGTHERAESLISEIDLGLEPALPDNAGIGGPPGLPAPGSVPWISSNSIAKSRQRSATTSAKKTAAVRSGAQAIHRRAARR
jgi:hypothetical protein